MSPRTQVGRRFLPPLFLPNIGPNQSTSRIIALTFLTKNVSNESAFFVQRAHPYRAFLRIHIRIKLQSFPTSLTVTRVPAFPITLTVPISLRVSYNSQSFFFFYLFIEIHNLSNLDIWWNFLTVKLAHWWLPPAGYHPCVC